MTTADSLKNVEQVVAILPGVRTARFSPADRQNKIYATVECYELKGFDAIARCGSGANVTVTLGNSKAASFRVLGVVAELECHVIFDDTQTERPSPCEIFGFYAAALLYNEAMIDDERLDELEACWKVNFGRDRR